MTGLVTEFPCFKGISLTNTNTNTNTKLTNNSDCSPFVEHSINPVVQEIQDICLNLQFKSFIL